MNILPAIKGIVSLGASLGAGAVVGNAIKATTPEGMKLASKIVVGVGGVVLASIAGDMAGAYIESQIQGVADGIRIGKTRGNEDGATLKDVYNDAAETVKKTAKKAGKAAADTVEETFPDEPTPPSES